MNTGKTCTRCGKPYRSGLYDRRSKYCARCRRKVWRESSRKYHLEHAEALRTKRKAHLQAHRDEINARRRQRRAANPERERLKRRRYRAKNRAKFKAWDRASYLSDAERKRAYSRKYRADHPDWVRATNSAYRRKNASPLKKYSRAYYREHREERKAYSRERHRLMMEKLARLSAWRDTIGRSRKDKQRERVKQLRAKGLEWEKIRDVVNQEFKEKSSVASYRALLRDRA
jgi:hypothetical protein